MSRHHLPHLPRDPLLLIFPPPTNGSPSPFSQTPSTRSTSPLPPPNSIGRGDPDLKLPCARAEALPLPPLPDTHRPRSLPLPRPRSPRRAEARRRRSSSATSSSLPPRAFLPCSQSQPRASARAPVELFLCSRSSISSSSPCAAVQASSRRPRILLFSRAPTSSHLSLPHSVLDQGPRAMELHVHRLASALIRQGTRPRRSLAAGSSHPDALCPRAPPDLLLPCHVSPTPCLTFASET